MLKTPSHPAGLLLIGAAPVAALKKAAAQGAQNLQSGKSALATLLQALASFTPAGGARLSWQTRAGAHGAVAGLDAATLLRAAGVAAAEHLSGTHATPQAIAGVARDQRGDWVAAVIRAAIPEADLSPSAQLAPGAGLCADEWGAAVVLGEDAALWALSPARKLADALQLNDPAQSGRELLLLARARRVTLAFAALSAAGEFSWGSPDGELPRAWAGNGPPPRQARVEKR